MKFQTSAVLLLLSLFWAGCSDEPIVNAETSFVLRNSLTETDHVVDVIELGTDGVDEVFFVLDGESMLDECIQAYESAGLTKKVKLVSIRYAESNKRSRDFTITETEEETGQAASFLEFLQGELDCALLNRSAYDSSVKKTLVGHSLGGLFTSYAVLKDTFFFDQFVALSPSLFWDDFAFFTLENEEGKNPNRALAVYLGAGKGEDFGINNGLDQFQDLLESKYTNIISKKETVSGSHMGSIEENMVNAYEFLLP